MAKLKNNKSKRKSVVSGFSAEYLNDRSLIENRRKLGLTRTIFSGVSLLMGASMFYVAMHYIPAFVNPKKVLQIASGDSTPTQTFDFEEQSKMRKVFGSYADLFHLNRAYMKPGQSISFKYDLPEGAHARLDIVQCSRAWVLEIFKCNVVGQYNSQTKRQRGIESFELKQGGFYHFNQKLVGIPVGENYSIAWERSL